MGSCLGKIFISLNTLEKSGFRKKTGYAVSLYAVTPLRGLLTTEPLFVRKCLATVYASFSWLQNSFEKYRYIFPLNCFLKLYHMEIMTTPLYPSFEKRFFSNSALL